MFSGLFVVVVLVVLPFRVQATTTVAPSATPSATTSQVSSSVSPTVISTTSPTPTPSATTSQVSSSVSPTVISTASPTPTPSATTSRVSPSISQTIQPTTEEPNNATTPLQPTPTTPISTEDKTCAKLTFTLEEKMTAVHKQSPSGLSYNISYELRMLCNDTNSYVSVTINSTPQDESVSVEAELCFAIDGKCVTEDVFKKIVKSGKLGEEILIKVGSETFEPLGVVFGEWKAKEGECKKCEGAAGPITVERTCTPKKHSCKGHKTSHELDDCVKYCPTDAGAGAVYCLYVLAIGIFLSFSFQ